MTVDEQLMNRCLHLAKKGIYSVAPNPMVGCVITIPDADSPMGVKILAEGYHQKFGEAHAEVQALNEVQENELLTEATLYVNLEPCSHYGKTPPCAELLIKSKIKRVVVCNLDPNPLVSGRGIKLLLEAGIEVKIGVLEQVGRELNKRFFHFHEKRAPFIVLKWAETQDGFIAKKNGISKWISNPLARQCVHKLRSENMAILIGKNTVINDKPQLNTRDWAGKSPIQLILSNQNLSSEMPPLTSETERYFFSSKVPSNEAITIDSLAELMQWCFAKNIHSVLVEGGSVVLNQFISEDFWNESYKFTGTSQFKEGIKAPQIPTYTRKEYKHLLNNTLEIFHYDKN